MRILLPKKAGVSMSEVADVLAIGGVFVILIGSIWFLIAAFKESVLWGLACLFIPLVSLFFLVIHFKEAAPPFLVQLIGVGLIVASSALKGGIQPG